MNYQFKQTPSAPRFTIDWISISKYPWISAMTGVLQEPEWHAEGDVFTHTHMVAREMAALPAWRTREETDRHLLFASALLHDVAKPACTRFEDGRWTSPRHAKVGEGTARQLLWAGEAGAVPVFHARERIAKLVRYHGLPLRFMDKPDPARSLILASLETPLDQLAILATADVLGRECNEKHKLIDSIGLFQDYAAELGCADGPKAFGHAHHRFMYCVGQKPIEYIPHIEKAFEVILMSGLPGSGKSTIVRDIAETRPVISLDEIRTRLDVDGADDQGAVIAAAKEQAKVYLRRRQPFIWDATNTSRDIRGGLIALFANYGATTRIVYVEPPTRAELFIRNRARAARVPEKVIARLAERLEVPSPVEAHHVEYRVG